MLIYVDPQSYTNHYIKELAIDKLPSFCEVTSDLNRLNEVDIYVAGFGQVTREMMEKAVKLKSIVRNAVGTDNIDKQAAKEYGIKVYNLPLVNYESVAEMVVGYMVACGRYMVFNHLNNVNHIKKDYYVDYQGLEIAGKTVGIIGYGHIGRRVGEILKTAFNCKVLFYDPYVEDIDGMKCYDYRDLLKLSDFVSIHVPLTPETANMINKETLSLCKKTCIIINAARVGIINEDDLYDALKNKQIWAAADDVLESDDSKLYTLENFIGTSHICGNSQEARRRVGEHLYVRLMKEIEKIIDKTL